MSGFDDLHPAVQYHIVNTLGWKSLRPLQEQSIDPVSRGHHAILLAPTAGGKTEAAIFPVLSRMLKEDWSGLSVLYVCPIKALLNNLEPRLRGYAELVGRRVGIWHGDVGQPARRRILNDPPDILLTTPESIEVMLTSPKTDHRVLFRGIQTLVIDEVHAFAGDDRGWHLLAVAERLTKIAGRDIQRLGLSATVGNAEQLADWLAGSSDARRIVVAPGIGREGRSGSASGGGQATGLGPATGGGPETGLGAAAGSGPATGFGAATGSDSATRPEATTEFGSVTGPDATAGIGPATGPDATAGFGSATGADPASGLLGPPPLTGAAAIPGTDVCLDYVGSIENAAQVIARLHRGEKRLVFCDSRSRVEQLAAELRASGVNTFVSHSSLSLDERRRAEEAFAEGRDAVIVATSTLELGIDVGDLDRVIQIDAPSTVASFLQRLGRTGRRTGTTRNCLFLTTSDHAFLQAAGLLQLWSEGFVEPVVPPPAPLHILAQQVLALVLQERGIGRRTWPEWVGGMPGFRALDPDTVEAVVQHMLDVDVLYEDTGILSFGFLGEGKYGYRNFVELVSVFTSDPLFAVRHGRADLGYVHPLSFITRNEAVPVVLLAGRPWVVTHIDWKERVAYVEASQSKGRSQWLGSGRALHFDLCRAVRKVLAQGSVAAPLTKRGQQALEDALALAPWVDEESTVVVRALNGTVDWWTFAGLAANTTLGAALGDLQRESTRVQNLAISLRDSVEKADLQAVLRRIDPATAVDLVAITDEAMEGLKFADCLPREMGRGILRKRMEDRKGVEACKAEPVRWVGW